MEHARRGTDRSVVQPSTFLKRPSETVGPSNQSGRELDLQLVPVQTGDGKKVTVPIGSEPTTNTNPLFQGGSLTFKPFIKDERKQARYEKYLSLVKLGKKG